MNQQNEKHIKTVETVLKAWRLRCGSRKSHIEAIQKPQQLQHGRELGHCKLQSATFFKAFLWLRLTGKLASSSNSSDPNSWKEQSGIRPWAISCRGAGGEGTAMTRKWGRPMKWEVRVALRSAGWITSPSHLVGNHTAKSNHFYSLFCDISISQFTTTHHQIELNHWRKPSYCSVKNGSCTLRSKALSWQFYKCFGWLNPNLRFASWFRLC